MASTNIIKQPLKYIEVPLSKFTEEVIPHHQKMLEQYKATIQKLILVNNVEQLKRETKDKKRTIKQLRDLMYELDTLRTQVEDTDLDKFDTKTLSLRKVILSLINGYIELEKTAEKVIIIQIQSKDVDKENCDPFEGASQIQIQENLDNLKLQQRQEQLNKVENINRDVGELQEMYKQLHGMVDSQGENVDHIEKTVDSTQGAFLGGIIGGPIGLVAGLKIGGVAALGCAIVGYTGGKYFKKIHDPEKIPREDISGDQVVTDTSQKKDI